MKNILYICTSENGGVSSVVNTYLSSNILKKHRLFLVSSHRTGSHISKIMHAMTGLSMTLYYLLMNNIDIVHIHEGNINSFKRKFYYLKLVSFFKCKVVFHHHGGALLDEYEAYSMKWQKRIKTTLETAGVVICLSEGWKDAVHKVAPWANIEVVPNPVTIPYEINKRENDTKNQTALAFLGHIKESKGIFDLLRVVKRLLNGGVNIMLYIGGSGDISRLKHEIFALQIERNVDFLGWISEVERECLLKKTDIFVLPSYSECLPMSILEAASYGVPVIATAVGGIPEIIADGKSGFLVQPGDLNMLYERLITLIENKELRTAFGISVRNIVCEKYNADIIIKHIDSIYNTI